jgi:hypothetical protein
VDPCLERGEIEQPPLHKAVDECAKLSHTRLPGRKAVAELSRVALDDPAVVLELVKVGRADDDVVHLAVADGVADDVRVGAAPGRRAWLFDQACEVGVCEELLSGNELATGVEFC